jgi:phosphatidylglycerol lysyltransferase
MKHLIEKLKSLKTVIRTVFFTSVCVLVIIELFRLRRTLSGSDLRAALAGIPPVHLLLMVLIGLAAVTPMLAYDFLLNRELGTDYPKSYILGTSWCVNTLNNLAGFGGIVDIGLRYSFYVPENKESDGMQAISRIMPYFMSGLSVYGAISLLLTFFTPVNPEIRRYLVLLAGTACYVPCLLFISSRKGMKYFGRLRMSTAARLLAASIADWTAVIACFVLTGRLMGISAPLRDLIPLYIIAIAVGLISMIPGGIGSFDLIMIAGLDSLGIGSASVVAWILLFRLVYYIIPFFFGILLFIHYMGGRINTKFHGIPKMLLTTAAHRAAVFLIRLFGIFLVLSALIPDEISNIPLLHRLDPLNGQVLYQFPSVLLGVLFILLARAVQENVSRAFPLSLCLLAVTFLYVNLGDISPAVSAILILLALMMAEIRPQLDRIQFIYSAEAFTRDFLILMFTLALFLRFGGGRAAGILLRNPHHLLARYGRLWLHLLAAVLVIAVIYQLTVRYLMADRLPFGEVFDDARFTGLLRKYGGDSNSGLAYLRDKRLYWYRENDADAVVFQFAQSGSKCVVMGEPIGDRGAFGRAVHQLLADAERMGYQMVFYEIGQSTTLLLHEYGYEFMKFGESALVNLRNFTTAGNHGKRFRTALNKLEKQGFTFEITEEPHSAELLDRLEVISDRWLHGRREKGFSLGFFDRAYLQKAPIALVKNSSGEICAFANIMPGCSGDTATIDLMRYDADLCPNGVMDFLFVSLFLYFQGKGVRFFDLGMAPLANVGSFEHSFFQERVGYLIYTFSRRFYSFTGLRQYKEKFSPEWSSRYVCYPKASWLVCDMLAVYRIDNRTPDVS